MNRPIDGFTNEELMALIPQQAYAIIGKATPEELAYYVKYNFNLDEQNKTELLLAFSYYETLDERKRNAIKYAIANMSVNYALNWIGQNNVKLLDAIESMFDKGMPVIDWFETQITRIKACLLTFDEMLARRIPNVATNTPSPNGKS